MESATSSIPRRWNRRLVLQFLAPTLAALAAVLVTVVPYVSVVLDRHEVESLSERLLAEARTLAPALPWTEGPALDAECARIAALLGARITVIDGDGRVLGESTAPSRELENHAHRAEVRAALEAGEAHRVRDSHTVGETLVYAAVRHERDGRVRVVRLAAPLGKVQTAVQSLRASMAAAFLVGIVIGLVGAALLSRRMLRRINRMVHFATRVSASEPPPYIGPEASDPLGLLEQKLGEMARNVHATISTLRVEHERLEAILRGMVEGVVVTDLHGAAVLANARARELLAIPADLDPRGRPLVELAREPAFAELPRELMAGHPVVSRDATISSMPVRTLQVNAARLEGPDGTPFGFVIVLHDVSELRRLEVIRRDFVANVSHELRTPLTAIKGYAETLLGPAGDDRERAREFLGVIDRHSERLARLIDDLLTLSNLELGRTPMRVGTVAIGPVIDDVVQILGERIGRSELGVEVHVSPDTPSLAADGDQLRQVLINLVDNAVKYTPTGGRIDIRAIPHPHGVAIDVEDHGIGIPKQDLPRLTERFFRVDKARSRELGGTGLGLAIVKHIVQAHGGSLSIDSEYGHGTTVHVLWPAAEGPLRRVREA